MFKITIKRKSFPEGQRRFSPAYATVVFVVFQKFFLAQISVHSQYAEDLEGGFSSDVESKYKKIYEDDINPFAAFSKKVPYSLLELLI